MHPFSNTMHSIQHEILRNNFHFVSDPLNSIGLFRVNDSVLRCRYKFSISIWIAPIVCCRVPHCGNITKRQFELLVANRNITSCCCFLLPPSFMRLWLCRFRDAALSNISYAWKSAMAVDMNELRPYIVYCISYVMSNLLISFCLCLSLFFRFSWTGDCSWLHVIYYYY